MRDQIQFRLESTFWGAPPTMAPTRVPLSVSLLESPVGPGGAVELEIEEALTDDGISSGYPNQISEQSRGGWFEGELTSDANHSGLVVRLINRRLRVKSQHEHVNRW